MEDEQYDEFGNYIGKDLDDVIIIKYTFVYYAHYLNNIF